MSIGRAAGMVWIGFYDKNNTRKYEQNGDLSGLVCLHIQCTFRMLDLYLKKLYLHQMIYFFLIPQRNILKNSNGMFKGLISLMKKQKIGNY